MQYKQVRNQQNKAFAKNLSYILDSEKQPINVNKNLHPMGNPCHNLPQICGGRKFVYPVWIRTTVNFKSHMRTSVGINEG